MNKKRRYWLMKSEPSCFSFEDLKQSAGQTDCWDGVRNYQARNLLRDEIKKGDGILFYHSNIKTPVIVGIAEVVQDGYPDYTAWDPKSEHYDPKSSVENPIWYMVDIQFVTDLEQPVTRNDLKAHPVLEKMGVMKRGNRLSVMPVGENEWQEILKINGMVDPLK
ncbi:MAG: EVE domain-containing protein [Desulfobacteraceae bacterium]|jgi:predicted RNA-binding protein with PUA-like domain|nr:EVE domain-containing protein [Desulfobacteraceae bacterium]